MRRLSQRALAAMVAALVMMLVALVPSALSNSARGAGAGHGKPAHASPPANGSGHANGAPAVNGEAAVTSVVAGVAIGSCPSTSGGGDVLVSCGSPSTTFPQNKQNEPSVAVDPFDPTIVAAGSNDEIDLQPCPQTAPTNDIRCPFTQGVGVSGLYFSSDAGASWNQPTYKGWTARDCTATSCTPHANGDIGTLPNYYEAGLASDGDPALAWGPAPDASGHFPTDWSAGARLYYGNLSANFSSVRSETAFKGFEAVAVSHTLDLTKAMSGDNTGWSAPVIVSKQNAALFSDKDDVWADNAASSPNFGNVYLCNISFRSQEISPLAAPEPVTFSRSTDGGDTWSNKQQLSAAVNNIIVNGRQGCAVRTDSKGVVYVFWEGSDPKTKTNKFYLARSFDGGVGFERPRIVADVVDVGALDVIPQGPTIDGVAGARTDSFPSVDIANGAPSGTDATDRVVLAWNDARDATPSPYSCCSGTIDGDKVLVETSTDQGKTFSAPVNATDPSDTLPDFPAIAISPDGQSVYLTYEAFNQPWQIKTTTPPRLQEGVVRTASSSDLTSWTTVRRGPPGDARASSANSLSDEFLGDYNDLSASRTQAVAVWNDVRNAADCPAVDTFRQALVDALTNNTTLPAAPWPGDCANQTFGNSDIYGGVFTAP
jgi:hypothetical protein